MSNFTTYSGFLLTQGKEHANHTAKHFNKHMVGITKWRERRYSSPRTHQGGAWRGQESRTDTSSPTPDSPLYPSPATNQQPNHQSIANNDVSNTKRNRKRTSLAPCLELNGAEGVGPAEGEGGLELLFEPITEAAPGLRVQNQLLLLGVGRIAGEGGGDWAEQRAAAAEVSRRLAGDETGCDRRRRRKAQRRHCH